MSQPLELELVLVSGDYAAMSAVSGGVRKYGAKFLLVPSAEAARNCLSRRKIDGIFIDLEVADALGLIDSIRRGTSNCKAVIFGCVKSSKEFTPTLNAGANFLLRKPLSIDSVMLHITIARELMARERRRYFRHAVNLPITLKEGETEQRARITNLSEEGMAVRTTKPVKHGSIIGFALEVSFGAKVSGKGQVAWTSSEGIAGITIQSFHGKGREHLESWLTAREQLSLKQG